jgi:hypothetical protein
MLLPMTGGCACGAIRYACHEQPMFTWICHRRECQRSTGAGGAVNIVFPKAAVEFTKGQPKFHTSTGTSGQNTHRGFCPECGSPLAAKADLIPDIHDVSAASLDNPGDLHLIADIWTDSVQPWDHLSPDTAKIATTPTPADVEKLLART